MTQNLQEKPTQSLESARQLNRLQNSGNFSYLNSYIQVLYHTPAFRENILNISKIFCGKIHTSLQDPFFRMNSEHSLSVTQLIESFNWPSDKMQILQDVYVLSHEFLKKLSKEISQHGENRFFKRFYGSLSTKFHFPKSQERIEESNLFLAF